MHKEVLDSYTQPLAERHVLGQFQSNSPLSLLGFLTICQRRRCSPNKIFLVTAYLFLIEAGLTHWNNPVPERIPQLREAATYCTASQHEFECLGWEFVTLRALAEHMSSIL